MITIRKGLPRRGAMLFFCLIVTIAAYSQVLTQTIKGKIVDSESESPLPGAVVVMMGNRSQLSASADAEGNFKIVSVPIGRHSIRVSLLGYLPQVIPEIYVGSGKELVVNIGLKQSVNQIKEVVVNAFSRKDQPLNTMAGISARSFSVEETRRYAGGMDDPARMVSAFAGVTVGNVQDNAIIIRGNNPKGVSWHLEGIEIPNPNHFAGGNVAGGGVLTVFSSQMLSNSDFFTGAFPAEYGNAMAGVFDMKLRNGNNEKHENTFQAGLLGIDISSEGPFRNGGKSTYLFNYRYSTFGLLTGLGLIPSQEIPRYQDLSFKLNFPTRKAGAFSLWGIGGIDHNTEPEETDSTKWETDWDRIRYNWRLTMGATGVSHKIALGNKTLLSSTLAISGTQNKYTEDRLDDRLVFRPNTLINDKSGRITLSITANHKFSPSHTVRTGLNNHLLMYNTSLSATQEDVPSTYQNFVNERGHTSYTEFFIESKHTFSSVISVTGGIYAGYFALNNHYSIDPRLSLKWDVAPGHALSFGYGMHSQMEELKMYLIRKTVNGKTEFPNKDLDLSRAQHFILGYDWLINSNLRLKIEPYFQYLYNVPGKPNSSYSMINFKQDWTFRDSLANNSKGMNYGVDLTLERFLSKNFYYLVTGSVFRSRYKADDGIWRNSRYDKGFVVNLLVGKEIIVKDNKVLGINGRLNFTGGERYSPILTDKSMKEKKVFYDDNSAFQCRQPFVTDLDVTVTWRINRKKYSSVWALQVKNMAGSSNFEGYAYNYPKHQIEKRQMTIVLPVISYKVEF